jgi:hypothetical protein
MNYVSNEYEKSKQEKPTILRYNMCIRTIDDLDNNDFYIVQDEKARRIHTTLTCTPKEARRFLTYRCNYRSRCTPVSGNRRIRQHYCPEYRIAHQASRLGRL